MNDAGNYNFYIVGLSILIAILASYSALNITGKVSHAKGRAVVFWLLAGSVVMGCGVWAMHFVGMLAFHMNMPVQYDVLLTIVSMSASVLSAFIAFWITMPKRVNWINIALGGLIMGCGIIAMHYIGMEAMVMPMPISYNKFWLACSILIALLASYAALILFLKFRHQPSASSSKSISAILMGVAICGMHYTGMKASNLEEHRAMMHAHTDNAMDPFLLYGVTCIVLVLLLISWGAMYFDRNVLEKLAYTDHVSGLWNRNEMNRFLSTLDPEEELAFLFLDLDQFKAINDTLSHDIGDLLIGEAGGRLSQFISNNTLVFRIGGDEFLIILLDANPEKAEALAENVLSQVEEAFYILGNELYITGSIGISYGKIGDTGYSVLLKQADAAMYEAKLLGKNRHFTYSEALGGEKIRKLLLENDLHKALAERQLYVVYQPQWNIGTNSLSGFESLLRWNHPEEGTISPAEFIPLAEETGLIIPMTRWVLEQACLQCKMWLNQGWNQSIAVNLSNKVFQSNHLLTWVKTALEQADLPPHLLELEITESMVMHDIEDIVRQVESIRALGVRFSLDDFGTGYSSIGLLDRIPLDCLKLDKMFIEDLDTPSKCAIVHGIIFMAKSLNLDIIAEGVENEDHISILSQLGCKVMQGYYYGKPMTPFKVKRWMDELPLQPFMLQGEPV